MEFFHHIAQSSDIPLEAHVTICSYKSMHFRIKHNVEYSTDDVVDMRIECINKLIL